MKYLRVNARNPESEVRGLEKIIVQPTLQNERLV